jgi:allantoicase
VSSLLPAPRSPLPGLIDLAAARVGGRALAANDEFFAPKENLLRPGRGVFIEGRYTDRGKWMDGWETRRRREPGHDWCVIRLGIPGVIRAVTVDTNHFRGNYPESCSLDAAAAAASDPSPDAVADLPWREIVPRTPLAGHAENTLAVTDDAHTTHVRLNIYPDGGVARLRVWGEARPDWAAITAPGLPVDLVAAAHGGVPLASSDEFFSEPLNLLMPYPSASMGDGWETRRRRGPGHDWVVIRLGHRGVPSAVELDTTHFKGNYPDAASLEACDAPDAPPVVVPGPDAGWHEVLPRTRLQANHRHRFDLSTDAAITHVRLNLHPDGGVARLRLFGRPV